MKALSEKFMCATKAWWVILLAGILMVICGFAYWIWPLAGYAIASQIFGWLLVLVGIVQLCVAAGPDYPRGWGWWIAGGIIDMFVGFMMVRSIVLSEVLLPYFLAFIFIYWGITSVINAFNSRQNKKWWLYLVNGILLMLIGFLFIEAGWLSDAWMVSFLTSIAFIYWGLTIAMISYDVRPQVKE